MKNLTKGTWIKIALIVALCLLVCISFAVGTTSCSNNAGGHRYGRSGTLGHVYDSSSVPAAPAAPAAPSAPAAPIPPGGMLATSAEFTLEEAREIDINWAAGSVDVYVVPDSECDGVIVVEEYFTGGSNKNALMRMDCQGGCLTLDYGDEQAILKSCSATGSKHLVVKIPASAASTLQKLVLNSASGSHTISDVTCGVIEINIASGNLEVNAATANILELDVASGKGVVEGVFTNELEVNVASGNVDITNDMATCAMTSISLMSGNLNLFLPEDADFSAVVDKLSGDFTCGFPCDYYDGHYESHPHGQHGNGAGNGQHVNGMCPIDISITSGNMRLDPIG